MAKQDGDWWRIPVGLAGAVANIPVMLAAALEHYLTQTGKR